MIAIITKYALKSGIYTAEIHKTDSKGNMIPLYGYDVFPKHHWFDNWEQAIREANKMRDDRIARLRKELNRLENLTFRELR